MELTAALAVTLVVALDVGGGITTNTTEVRAADCIGARLVDLVQDTRLEEAALRVEVQILDDDCGQTVQMILWRAPSGAVKAKGAVADHAAIQKSLLQLQRERPDRSDEETCAAVAIEEMKADASQLPRLAELAEGLEEMMVSPVLPPILMIHGLQYNIRVESGISESTFVFHAPGHRRPPMDTLQPLDRWSQEVREALGLGCKEGSEPEEQPRQPLRTGT